jgi:fibronectin type 3 domain-containing protein
MVLYYFGVEAMNAAGDSPLSNVRSAIPYTVPDAPTLTSATEGVNSTFLVWTAPSSDGGSPITGYKVYYQTSSPPNVLFGTFSASTLAVNVTGLAPGTLYHFAVKAVNIAGDSPLSNAKTAVPYTVPGAPTLTSITGGVNSAILVWTAPATNGGRPITGYKVYYGLSDPTTQFGGKLNASTLTVNVTGLTPGTLYHLAVRAVNVAGNSPRSNILNATAVSVPGAPTGLTITTGNGKLTLAWASPSQSGGCPVTCYKVYRGTISGSLTFLTTVTSTSYADSNVTNGQAYFYKVSAVSSVGESALTTEATAAPSPPSPGGGDMMLIIAFVALVALAGIGAGLFYLRRKR